MARKEPVKEVLRALFARSGNQCAFPGCTQSLISTNNKFIGQLCHIEAASPGGERYNSNQTDEERRAYDNLILMCYPHHIETDDTEAYTVDTLKEIKYQHESSSQANTFKVNEEVIYRLASEMESYWGEINLLNSVKHVCEEYAVPIKSGANFFDIQKDVLSLVDGLEEVDRYFEESDEKLTDDLLELMESLGYDTQKIQQLKYYENPFYNRNWEMRNLRQRNNYTMLRVALQHLEIKYLEEYLKTNSNDLAAANKLEVLKEGFKHVAQNAGLAD